VFANKRGVGNNDTFWLFDNTPISGFPNQITHGGVGGIRSRSLGMGISVPEQGRKIH